ncbi:MAG: bifunctional folylpolyglutamate synthase/dihydrofolate synthase [Firmicutes bacterium]|nr:bifunctional folylpolyglutamate synthase/dihydrofolate synthase [Bacillota bacterium]
MTQPTASPDEEALATASERLATLSRFGIRLGLERMAFLLDALGHPERSCAVIHVGGTNGKGSVSAMIAAVLTAAGYRTALYTSPHLHRVTERFRLDGRELDPHTFAALLDDCWPLVERAQAAGLDPPTEFEMLTAIAYLWARESGAEILVQEVGLGGRLDSTNLVEEPLLCVLTNIGLDHTDRLGSTIEAIAREKAGIVKPGRPVVTAFQGEALQVLRERCAACGSPLLRLDERARYEGRPVWGADGAAEWRLDYEGEGWQLHEVRLALPGRHQLRNAALALLALETAAREGGLRIPEPAVRRGLVEVRWPGRLELFTPAGGPRLLFDGAHNAHAAAELAATLPESFRWRRLHAVLGMLADKDVEGALPLLARHADRAFLAPPPGARAAAPERLAAALRAAAHPSFAVFDDARAAFAAAMEGLGPQDLVLVAGSLYLVGALRPWEV